MKQTSSRFTAGNSRLTPLLLLATSLSAPAQSTPDAPTYYEFGTVTAIGERNVVLQTFDQQTHRPAQHSFLFSRDARADVVRIDDPVEVIYIPTGNDFILRRLVLLSTGIPAAGPPPPAGSRIEATPATRMAVPTPIPTHISRAEAKKKAAPPQQVGLSSRSEAKGPASSLPASTTTAQPAVSLGNPNALHAAPLTAVPLGVSSDATIKLNAPGTKAIAHDTPSEECNRSSADWPSQPLRIAVIDFRYPTEREESHDNGTTGGGSGTAVADLVFARLEEVQEFAVQRGDRRKLDRTDIAGAARLGRQLGVDAVLAGTFAPVEDPTAFEDDLPRAYELHAGLVDTCTGQVLMKLSSDPTSVQAKEAANPQANMQAFRAPLDTLLYPLEHNSTAPGQPGAVGVVTVATPNTVTIRLTSAGPGSRLKPGDQLAVHATRLTKNPTTYTLNILHDQEIGRMAISTVDGATATGSFIGDISPRIGDTAELISIAKN